MIDDLNTLQRPAAPRARRCGPGARRGASRNDHRRIR